jgi:hypothetical protein
VCLPLTHVTVSCRSAQAQLKAFIPPPCATLQGQHFTLTRVSPLTDWAILCIQGNYEKSYIFTATFVVLGYFLLFYPLHGGHSFIRFLDIRQERRSILGAGRRSCLLIGNVILVSKYAWSHFRPTSRYICEYDSRP